MKKALITISIFLLIGYLSICYFFSSRIILPNRRALEDPQELVGKYGLYEDISFETSDGLKLNGWLFENPADSVNCGIILVHGHGTNRYSMRHWMPYFWVKGCDVLMYDHRAHGESEGTYGTFGIKESEDLLGIHERFKDATDLSNEQVGWVGSSWGAATVLQAAPAVDNLSFLLADSPFKDLNTAVMERAIRDYGSWIKLLKPTIFAMVRLRAGFDPEQASTLAKAVEIRTPVLLIHSQTDEATSSDQSEAIAKAMNPENLIFHHTDWGSLHVKDVQNFPERYWALIDEFMEWKME